MSQVSIWEAPPLKKNKIVERAWFERGALRTALVKTPVEATRKDLRVIIIVFLPSDGEASSSLLCSRGNIDKH